MKTQAQTRKPLTKDEKSRLRRYAGAMILGLTMIGLWYAARHQGIGEKATPFTIGMSLLQIAAWWNAMPAFRSVMKPFKPKHRV